MEILDVLQLRHSCRKYTDREIESEILDSIIEAGRIAPSAQNRQPWRYIVVKDREIIRQIAFHSFVGMTNFFIQDAPIVIIACGDTKSALRFNGQDYYLVDVATSFTQMMLTGWHYGIGSCWIGAFDEGNLKKLLDIPAHYRVVAMSPFGYPAEPGIHAKVVSFFARSSKRKDVTDIVKFIN
jgi:nitroreductase